MNGNNKKLNLLATICLLASGMIGSAIFSLSGLTISYAGPASVLSWIFAAIIQLLYGLSMAELATTYNKSGGVFVFPENSYEGEVGTRLGFMSAWGNLMADIVSIAFSSMYIGIYLSASFPQLSKYQVLISIISIFLCLVLNSIRFSTTGKINVLLSTALFFILIIFSYMAISHGGFDIGKFNPFFSQGIHGTFGFLKAIPIAMIGYSSVMSISFMVSDVDNPSKNLKKAVYIGTGIVALLYVMVIFSTVGTITAKELVDSDMTYIPLFAVCMTKLQDFPYIKILISLAACIALLTTMLVVMAINGRCTRAIAEKNLLPKTLAKVKNDTPVYAMTVLSFIAAILSFFPQITETLVNLGALFAIVTIVINFLSLVVTRKKKRTSSFRAPIGNQFIYVIMIVFVICYMPDILTGGYKLIAFSLIWYAIGFLVYKVYRK